MRAAVSATAASMRNRGLAEAGSVARHPLRTCEYVAVPLLLRCVQVADQLAVSATARGADSPGARGSYHVRKLDARGVAWMAPVSYTHLDVYKRQVYGGDFLANQPQVKRMCDAAPALIHMFDRMGVMFSRTPEGLLDFRRFGGTLVRRTAYAGATTGQQLLYALDEQVRRLEVEGKVTKYEGWEFVSVSYTHLDVYKRQPSLPLD